MRVVICCPAHNNVKYTKMFLDSIKTSYPHRILVIDNGSTDETQEFLETQHRVQCIRYEENRGFSYAYNDALDYTFKDLDTLLLFCGNDTVFRPESIDFLVRGILETDYEMLCGNEILNKEILEENEKAMANFKYKFSFDEKKYDKLIVSHGGMNHSCLIRQKSSFDKVGYYDVNFYPAYFEDNDYARRCNLSGVKYGTVESATFYHFWSRTIYEGGLKALNDRRFNFNRDYYFRKWGGEIGSERYDQPFGVDSVKIDNRDQEEAILHKFGVL